jgi:hypothetical protein
MYALNAANVKLKSQKGGLRYKANEGVILSKAAICKAGFLG